MPTLSFSLPTFPAKSLGHANISSACLILGSDPDAVGVCVALQSVRQLWAGEPISISQANFVLVRPLQSVRQTLCLCAHFYQLWAFVFFSFISFILFIGCLIHLCILFIMCIICCALYSSVCIIYFVHYLFMHKVQWDWACN